MADTSYIRGFGIYLRLEKHLSEATIECYLRDVRQFTAFLQNEKAGAAGKRRNEEPQAGSKLQSDSISQAAPAQDHPTFSWKDVTQGEVEAFMKYLFDMELAATTQARILSGIKTFFGYLAEEGEVKISPAEPVDSPQWRRHLPEVLSVEEIDSLLQKFDLSTPEGRRNKTMVAVLYACGLRVSELTGLRISCLSLDEGFVRVIGKGDKERLVPIGQEAVHLVENYLRYDRSQLKVKPGCEDLVFLSRRGSGLSREMVFMMIKQTALEAGVSKTVSPHSFRHSFATHLVEGGADLRAVQEMLGHSSITTTEIYMHLDKRYLRETIQQFHPLSKFHSSSCEA